MKKDLLAKNSALGISENELTNLSVFMDELANINSRNSDIDRLWELQRLYQDQPWFSTARQYGKMLYTTELERQLKSKIEEAHKLRNLSRLESFLSHRNKKIREYAVECYVEILRHAAGLYVQGYTHEELYARTKDKKCVPIELKFKLLQRCLEKR